MNAVATLAAAIATAVAVVHAEPCNLLALAPIATGSAAAKCTQDSGLQFMPPTMPSADQIPKLCASAACKSLLAELKKAAPTECTIAITTPPMALYAQIVTPLEKACESSTAPTTAPAPVHTTTAPTAAPAIPTPSPTTAPSANPLTTAPSEGPATPEPTKGQC